MGQDSSKFEKNNNSLKSFSKYEIIGKERHPIYGELIMMKNEGNNFFMKELIYQNSSEIEKEIKFFKEKKKNQNLIQLIDYSSLKENYLCSNMYKLNWICEYISRDIYSELNIRKLGEKNYFSEEELWFLLGSLISVLNFLQIENTYHGCLRTSTIFLNDEGIIKLIDPSLVKCMNNFSYLISGYSSQGWI